MNLPFSFPRLRYCLFHCFLSPPPLPFSRVTTSFSTTSFSATSFPTPSSTPSFPPLPSLPSRLPPLPRLPFPASISGCLQLHVDCSSLDLSSYVHVICTSSLRMSVMPSLTLAVGFLDYCSVRTYFCEPSQTHSAFMAVGSTILAVKVRS